VFGVSCDWLDKLPRNRPDANQLSRLCQTIQNSTNARLTFHIYTIHIDGKLEQIDAALELIRKEEEYRSKRSSPETNQHSNRRHSSGGHRSSVRYDDEEFKCEVEEYLWTYIQEFHREAIQQNFTHSVPLKTDSTKFMIFCSSDDRLEVICDIYRPLAQLIACDSYKIPSGRAPKEFAKLRPVEIARADKFVLILPDSGNTCRLIGPFEEVSKMKMKLDKMSSGGVHSKHNSVEVQQHNPTFHFNNSADTSLSVQPSGSKSFQVCINPERNLDVRMTFNIIGIQVHVGEGDLVKQSVYAIVNPANSHLDHGGGAAKIIADAAGKELLVECREFIRKNHSLKVSNVVATTAGRLRPGITYVIHVSGPHKGLQGMTKSVEEHLVDAFFNCMVCANDDLKAPSIAIPAISSGW